MNKRILIGLLLLIFFSSYKPQIAYLNTRFAIQEIKIENTFILKDSDIKNDLSFLYKKNLIFLKMKKIEEVLKKINFVESFEVKKIYPNKLKIIIVEKKPIAIMLSKDRKFYLSKNLDLFNFEEIENYKNLPLIFGNKDSFKDLYKNFIKINFPINLINKYYLYEAKRWDLETYKKKIIKLPAENYIKSLENFMSLRESGNFEEFTLFDYRINNQLILK